MVKKSRRRQRKVKLPRLPVVSGNEWSTSNSCLYFAPSSWKRTTNISERQPETPHMLSNKAHSLTHFVKLFCNSAKVESFPLAGWWSVRDWRHHYGCILKLYITTQCVCGLESAALKNPFHPHLLRKCVGWTLRDCIIKFGNMKY